MTDESRRHDLYNGLIEIFGEDRADTLMAYLPTHQFDDLATSQDVKILSTRIDALERDIDERFSRVDERFDRVDKHFDRLTADMISRFDTLNGRLDRIVLTLAAGLIAIIVAMIGHGFF